MARVRFLTDEHIPKAVAKGLRERGVDTLTMAEAGTLGAEDQWLLEFAKGRSRVLITNDPDFLRLHAAGATHAGIAYAAPHTAIGDVIRGALLIAEILDSDDMTNHVEFL